MPESTLADAYSAGLAYDYPRTTRVPGSSRRGARRGGPGRVRGGRVEQEVEQRQVAAQRAPVAVRLERVEPAERRQDLRRILSHPGPRAHLERERQQHAAARRAPAIVEVVPQIAADRVGLRGLLEVIDVVGQRVVEQAAERG